MFSESVKTASVRSEVSRCVTRPRPPGVSVPAEDVPVSSGRPLSGPHQDGAVGASGQPAGGAAHPGAAPQQAQHHQGRGAHTHTRTHTIINQSSFLHLVETKMFEEHGHK